MSNEEDKNQDKQDGEEVVKDDAVKKAEQEAVDELESLKQEMEQKKEEAIEEAKKDIKQEQKEKEIEEKVEETEEKIEEIQDEYDSKIDEKISSFEEKFDEMSEKIEELEEQSQGNPSRGVSRDDSPHNDNDDTKSLDEMSDEEKDRLARQHLDALSNRVDI